MSFWTTVVLEAAERSLRAGPCQANGSVHGKPIGVPELLKAELGDAASQY